MTRTPLSRSKGQRSRSPGRFAHSRVSASGGCSGGRGNVLAVGNCCYIAVCSAAQGASAPMGRRGGGISWRPPARLQLVDLGEVVRLRLDVAVGAFINETVLLLRTRPTHSVSAGIEFGRPDIQWQRPNCPQPVVRALSVAAGDRAFCLPFTVVFNYSAPAEDPSHHGRLVALYNFT